MQCHQLYCIDQHAKPVNKSTDMFSREPRLYNKPFRENILRRGFGTKPLTIPLISSCQGNYLPGGTKSPKKTSSIIKVEAKINQLARLIHQSHPALKRNRTAGAAGLFRPLILMHDNFATPRQDLQVPNFQSTLSRMCYIHYNVCILTISE